MPASVRKKMRQAEVVGEAHGNKCRINGRKRSWARFQRSREESKGVRKRKVEPVPKELAQKMKDNPETVHAMFDLWMALKQKWGKVLVYCRKYARRYSVGRSTKRWMTHRQLLEHYKEKELVVQLKEISETRPHADIPDEEMAKKFPQYLVTIADDTETGKEEGTETGLNISGELGADDEDLVPSLLKQLEENTAPKESTAAKLEREQKKKNAELAKEQKEKDKAKRLKHDMSYRASEWLKGIRGDMAKIKEAHADAAALKDKALGNLYKTKFNEYDTSLTKFREKFEAATSCGKAVKKEEIKEAEKIIKKAKDDLGLFKKIKPKQIK